MLDSRRPVEERGAVELAALARVIGGAASDKKDGAVDKELLAAVDVGGVLRGNGGAKGHLELAGQAGEQDVTDLSERDILGLILVEEVSEHAAARVSSEAVVVIATNAGEVGGDEAGGGHARDGGLGPLGDGCEAAAHRRINDGRVGDGVVGGAGASEHDALSLPAGARRQVLTTGGRRPARGV